MKALLITPDSQSIEGIDISGLDDIKGLIGFDTLASDAVGDAGDRIYFDEECFLRQTSGRFQVGTLIPISGKAVIVGSADGGETLCDISIGEDDLRSMLKYL